MRRHDDERGAGSIEAVLEEAHTPVALLAGTVVASPVLLAALGGRQDVGGAVGLWLLAIAGCWIVAGVVGGALTMSSPRRADTEPPTDPDEAHAAGDPDPSPASR